MENLFSSEEPKHFYVWINPKDVYAYYNALMMGSFFSVSNREDNLMFLPNQNFSGYISPFQSNLLRGYQTEHNLELVRKNKFKEYPSRLVSTFLFENEDDAMLYKDFHDFHVSQRELKKGVTVGAYTYSRHDLSWIDFLKSPLLVDNHVKNEMHYAYWEGKSVENFKLELMEKPLSAVAQSIYEILFLGRIDFLK
jgi:hypothetical protein